MIKNSYIVSILVLGFLLNLFACDRGPYSAIAEGYVRNSADSSNIPLAQILVMHWDGNDKHDTTFFLSKESDSSGYFNFRFEYDANNEFFWARAKKDGYNNSSWEHIDKGSTNYFIIRMDSLN